MYFLGVDIGSSSSKAVIIDENYQVIAENVINLGTGTNAQNEVVETVLDQARITREDISYTIVTGYGRMTFEGADKQITEITCHGKGVHTLFPSARTIIDIGGQDAKCIRLDSNGNVVNFVMNEKCAAGTGRFLEVMARVLGCKIDELSRLSKESTKLINISNVCTVFAESEVISQLASGANRADVANGAHISIARRVCGMANRVGVVDDVVMTGGVALNESMLNALEKESGHKIFVPANPQSTGAFGAAVLAEYHYMKEVENNG